MTNEPNVSNILSTSTYTSICSQAGEIICVDDPSVSMLCPDEKEGVRTHCLHCFRATKAPLPCDVSIVTLMMMLVMIVMMIKIKMMIMIIRNVL